jgi:hypothetical protein
MFISSSSVGVEVMKEKVHRSMCGLEREEISVEWRQLQK